MNNYINNDTITAISTPVGVGAIAMIRMSGTESLEILDCFFRHSANTTIGHRTCVYGQIYDNCELVDDVIVTYYKSPESYTGEDMVEISCHGSVYIQQTILDLIVRNGARLALPGEFTFRAYRNGKLDLAQSEAVSELITSENKKSHDIAISQLKGRYSSRIKSLRDRLVELLSLLELELDFSDEDVEFAKRDEFMALLDTLESELKSLINSFDLGNALRNGIPVTIIGKPNVGKSTLLNCLLDEDKAIVSDIPGTTRDIVEDVININGYVFRFIDTAGLHKTDDVVENMGIERTMEKIKNAKIILHVVDATKADRDSIKREMTEFQSYLHEEASSPSSKKWVVVVNKIDKAGNMGKHIQCTNDVCDRDVKLIDGDNDSDWIFISAKKGENIKAIIDLLCDYVKSQDIDSRTIVTNVRHVEAMREALAAIQSACKGFEDGIPTDLVAIDVHQASYSLGSIIGEISNNELLDSIFGHFCIGK